MAQAGPGWGAGPSTGLWGRLGVGVVPRTGKLTEGSSRVMIMAFMGVVGASALLTWYEQKFMSPAVESLSPDFRKASAALGDVSTRTSAPPVYRNPFRNNIPGYIVGPDDPKG